MTIFVNEDHRGISLQCLWCRAGGRMPAVCETWTWRGFYWWGPGVRGNWPVDSRAKNVVTDGTPWSRLQVNQNSQSKWGSLWTWWLLRLTIRIVWWVYSVSLRLILGVEVSISGVLWLICDPCSRTVCGDVYTYLRIRSPGFCSQLHCKWPWSFLAVFNCADRKIIGAIRNMWFCVAGFVVFLKEDKAEIGHLFRPCLKELSHQCSSGSDKHYGRGFFLT